MARIKVYAHHGLMVAALLGFFAVSSAVAYQAAGAAYRVGSYVGGY